MSNKKITQIKTSEYVNGNIRITLYAKEKNSEFKTWDAPYAEMTLGVAEELEPYQAYVNTNKYPWIEEFIEKNKLGKKLDRYYKINDKIYQMYIFNLIQLSNYKGEF